MFRKSTVRQFSNFAAIIFLMCLLFSCSGRVGEEKSEVDNSKKAPLSSSLFEQGLLKLAPWTSYWQNLGMPESTSAFKKTGDMKIELLERPEVNPIKEGEHPLASYQFDHPAGNGTVDIYHYKLHISETLQVSFEPDAEVIYYRKNGMRERLLFIGPSGLFEDAVWIDNSSLMVVGYFEEEVGFSPMVWIVDVEKSSYQLFESDFVVSDFDRFGYLKRKLSALNFGP